MLICVGYAAGMATQSQMRLDWTVIGLGSALPSCGASFIGKDSFGRGHCIEFYELHAAQRATNFVFEANQWLRPQQVSN